MGCLGVFVLAALGVSLHSGPSKFKAQAGLDERKTSLRVEGSAFDALFAQRLSGSLVARDPSRFDIYVESSLGRWRSSAGGGFSLPVDRRDTVWIEVLQRPDDGSKIEAANLTLHRRLMPGGWLLLLLPALLALALRAPSGPGALVAALVALLAGSVTLQVVDPWIETPEPWQLFPPHFVRENHVLPGILPGVPEGISWFRINSEGIRARERDLTHWTTTTSILAIGASSTENLYLDQDQHWPALLEQRLTETTGRDVWVGNAGRSGYGTAKLVTVARNYIPRIKPKYVVLLTGFGEGVDPGGRFPGEIHSDERLVERLGATVEQSAIVRLLGQSLFRREVTPLDQVVVVKDNLWYAAARSAARRENPPGLAQDRHWGDLDLTQFSNDLRSIATIAHREGSQLVLCTHPTIYRENMSTAEENLLWMLDRYTTRSMRERMDVINDRIRAVAAELSVPLIDLDRALPRSTEAFYDDCHLNRNGAHLVAGELERFFVHEIGPRSVADRHGSDLGGEGGARPPS
jgi:hypothetical protein